jgi:hypothetical protein
LYLVSKGVPYDLALRMSPARRLAYVVTLGTLDGGVWDWATQTWQEKR